MIPKEQRAAFEIGLLEAEAHPVEPGEQELLGGQRVDEQRVEVALVQRARQGQLGGHTEAHQVILRFKQHREDCAGERQMKREPVLRHPQALDEAGRHHPPADRALYRAQSENRP